MEPSVPVGTFAALAGYLGGRGHPCTVSPAGDLLQCRFDDARVSSLVAMRPVRTAAGSEWLAMSIPICPVERIRLRGALVATDELPIGALADWNGLLLLRQTLPLASLTGAQLERALGALAHTAASIAAAAIGAAPPPDLAPRCGYLFP